MSKHISSLSFCLALAAGSLQAAVAPINSVTLDTGGELLTATVGTNLITSFSLATSAQRYPQDASLTNFPGSGTFSAGSIAPVGVDLVFDDGSQQSRAYDDNVGSWVGGATNNATQTGGVLKMLFGGSGGFTDNDDAPDFFVFELGGNDPVSVQAVLGSGILGAAISITPTTDWNNVAAATLAANAQGVWGTSFGLTDLLDESGVNLTLGTTIRGFVIGAQNAADFSDIYANVVAVPEPTTFALAGLGLAGLLILRRRR